LAVAVLVVAGAVTAYAATRSSGPSYRTAAAAPQNVQQTLSSTGSIQPGSSANVSFPVSGTVASVAAVLGDPVKAGQQLAALDTTALNTAVAAATATLARARLTLYQGQTGQTASTNSSATGTSATGTSAAAATSATSTSARSGSSAGSATAGKSGTGGSTQAIAMAQQRLLATVHQADQALATTTSDLTLAGTLCPPPPPPVASTGPGTGPASPATVASTTPAAAASTGLPLTGVAGPPAGRPVPTTCAQAQQLVLTDETQVQRLQQAVSAEEIALDKLLAAAAKSSTGTSTSTRTSTSTSTRSTTGSTTVAVSAAALAADQAGVDAAVTALAVANQNLTQAVLVAPISGLVSSVGVTVGQKVSGGASSTAIDVIDPTAHSVSLSVAVTNIPLVKVGQAATVVPDGTGTTLHATVSYVAAAPSTSGGSTYLVRLAFTAATGSGLRNGIQASVSLVVAQATDVLAVPTSAVHHLGTLSYVTIVDGTTLTRRIVSVGAVGPVFTQIIRGLSAGQEVLLADVTAPIPTSTVNSRLARFAGAGGLGGLAGAPAGSGGLGGGAVGRAGG